MLGKTIHIYLPDGNPRGIKICDIDSSLVNAVYIPRKELKKVADNEDLKEPGIYFLIKKDEGSKPEIYIGEAENLYKRLKQQNTAKGCWNIAIAFTSVKKNGINKAHIKYLESHCYEKASEINKCELKNGNAPKKSKVRESEKDLILRFFNDLKILISVLGYPIFDESEKDKKDVFICKIKEARGEGIYSDDGFIVFKDSTSMVKETPGCNSSISNLRKSLVDKEILKERGDVYVFTENYTFSSPSAAAGAIHGGHINGWIAWKDTQKKTLDERMRKGN